MIRKSSLFVVKIVLSVRKRSVKQEKGIAADMNCRVVPGSGSSWACKGDIRGENFLIEAKYTDENYYALKLEIWNKIKKEATKDSLRIPIMCIKVQEKEFMVLEKGIAGIEGKCAEIKKKSFRITKELELPYIFSFNPKTKLCIMEYSKGKEVIEELK